MAASIYKTGQRLQAQHVRPQFRSSSQALAAAQSVDATGRPFAGRRHPARIDVLRPGDYKSCHPYPHRPMNTKDLIRLGVPPGDATRRGIELISRYILKGLDRANLAADLEAVIRHPQGFVDDELRGEFARTLLRSERPLRAASATWRQWGENLEPESVNQMGRACQLPVAVAGALMPDAHVGYGLPIGGVLATENAVIPYAVGVDIACRMKLTVLDLPVRELDRQRERLIKAIETETRFGVGATFQHRRDHEVLEADWTVSPITRQNQDRAWAQLGTSGSGNHFVEFGLFTAGEADRKSVV